MNFILILLLFYISPLPEIANNYKVAISGDGGDELLADIPD